MKLAFSSKAYERFLVDAPVGRAARFGCAVLALFVYGCSEGHSNRTVQMTRRVSLKGLEEATRGDPCICYCGDDATCHYFEAFDGREFLVSRDEWNLHPAISINAGIRMFVTINDGRIKPADPSATRHWRPRASPSTTNNDKSNKWHLPVTRYDESARPPLLVLTSDGWPRDELARLDDVLNDWVAHECSVPTQMASSDAQAPRLWFDRNNSSGDLKTVRVRAENFQSEWSESLAERLGTEFPFLWQLEIGDNPWD